MNENVITNSNSAEVKFWCGVSIQDILLLTKHVHLIKCQNTYHSPHIFFSAKWLP